MEEFTMAETVYLLMAIRKMMDMELSKSDREAYEKLWYKLKISHKGKKIRRLLSDG